MICLIEPRAAKPATRDGGVGLPNAIQSDPCARAHLPMDHAAVSCAAVPGPRIHPLRRGTHLLNHDARGLIPRAMQAQRLSFPADQAG